MDDRAGGAPRRIAVFTVGTLLRLDDNAGADELDGMEILGLRQQWWWAFEYDFDADGEPEIVTANELVLPADVPVTVNIESRDVIHSFWIPALNGTRDAVPGRTHSLVLESDEPGEFFGSARSTAASRTPTCTRASSPCRCRSSRRGSTSSWKRR